MINNIWNNIVDILLKIQQKSMNSHLPITYGDNFNDYTNYRDKFISLFIGEKQKANVFIREFIITVCAFTTCRYQMMNMSFYIFQNILTIYFDLPLLPKILDM